MELDDFKKRAQGAGPVSAGSENTNTDIKTDAFIENLKATDLKERKKVFLLILFFGMFVVIYAGSFISKQGTGKEGYSILILGFCLAMGYLFYGLLKYKKVDYGEPAVGFLKHALARYRFISPVDLIITTPMLLLFITGGYLIVQSSFLKYMENTRIPVAIYLVIMLAAVAIGYWASYKNWKRHKKPLQEEIMKRLKEFEGQG